MKLEPLHESAGGPGAGRNPARSSAGWAAVLAGLLAAETMTPVNAGAADPPGPTDRPASLPDGAAADPARPESPSVSPAGDPGAASGWRTARPGWDWQFPRDHFSHPDFRTEWWYATGQLSTAAGRKFGYQFTLFRRGVRPPGDRAPAASAWVVDHLPLAHFALTDITRQQFYFHQRLERGAFGQAGFPAPDAWPAEPRLAWTGDWNIALTPPDAAAFTLQASQPGASLRLKLERDSTRPPVLQGRGGYSQKSAGEGNASLYYSLPRLRTTGTVTLTESGETHSVTGLSWLDREWATNQLAPEQLGWDWFALRLSDGSSLMLYQLRQADGRADPFSSGSLTESESGSGGGRTRVLRQADFELSPVSSSRWTSPRTGGIYPLIWKIRIPSVGLELETAALMPAQELALQPVAYWEGAISAQGTRHGRPVTAEGYLEMTGYTGPLHALKQ